jgi:CMP/dCMP kinase
MVKKLIVAIDGPAGSGKSTSAKLVAQKLGYLYIDTGAMYRAVTYLALKKNVMDKYDMIVEIACNTDIKLNSAPDGGTMVYADGENITGNIRTPEVNANVSYISKIPEVRKALVSKQRQMGENDGGIVMEGRDISTVVFPYADVKIFMVASIEQRAKRRAKEFKEKGMNIPIDEIRKNILSRDELDSTRKASPLQKAPDAIEIDTSNCTIEEQVQIILDRVKTAAMKKGIEISVSVN